ncbi:hypothetical protein C8J55DRAFT_439656, partial [Lentinula edodes]
QRLKFEKALRNIGRVYTHAFSGFARHINYGAYVLWRMVFVMASAGWTWWGQYKRYVPFPFMI